MNEVGFTLRDRCSPFYFFRYFVYSLHVVTFDTDCLSADRLHVYRHDVLLKLILMHKVILMLKVSGDLPTSLCGDREDVIVELIFFMD